MRSLCRGARQVLFPVARGNGWPPKCPACHPRYPGLIDDIAHRCKHRRVLAHTQVVAGTPISHPTLQAVIKGLGKMTVGPLEIAKDPRSVFPLYELEMRLNELIEIHCALFRLCASAEPSEASRRKRSSESDHSPFAIGGGAAALSGQDRVHSRFIPRQCKRAIGPRRAKSFGQAFLRGSGFGSRTMHSRSLRFR